MLANIILIIIAITVILFTGLLWLRHSLLVALRKMQQMKQVLQSDFDHRRDVVPYLLESARQSEAPTDAWRHLAEVRGTFHKPNEPQAAQMDFLTAELAFENTLKKYLSESTVRNIHYLDAKRDIEKLSGLLEKQINELNQTQNHFEEMKKQFPYSLAATLI